MARKFPRFGGWQEIGLYFENSAGCAYVRVSVLEQPVEGRSVYVLEIESYEYISKEGENNIQPIIGSIVIAPFLGRTRQLLFMSEDEICEKSKDAYNRFSKKKEAHLAKQTSETSLSL